MLENSCGPVYADNSYHIAISESKQVAIRNLQERIIESESWQSGSGLKVNLEKTELTIFHRHDTSSANIKMKEIVGQSLSTLAHTNTLRITLQTIVFLIWSMPKHLQQKANIP